MRGMLLAAGAAVAAASVTAPAGVHAGPAPGFVTIDPQPENAAWWLRARFHPTGTAVHGIPVGRIARGWCKATAFQRDQFGAGLDFDDGLVFTIDGSLDDSQTPQTALTGAFETCTGATGGFVLILQHRRGAPPVVRFVDTVTGEHFLILRNRGIRPGAALSVWSCMSCDGGADLVWDRVTRKFRLRSIPEGDQ